MKELFLRGVPTAVDVRILEEKFGVPTESDVITYEDIESVLKIKRDVYRFKTVLLAWHKKLLNEQNIFIITVRNIGVKAATPDERIEWSSKAHKRAKKLIFRGVNIATTTDAKRLSDDKKRDMRKFIIDVPNRIRLLESLNFGGNKNDQAV